MHKDPNYLTKNNIRIIGPNGSEDRSDDDRLVRPRTRRSSASARIPGKINAMASVKINFPSPRRRLHARHAAAEPVPQADALRFVGLRARAERARPRHLAAARHARLGPPAHRADDQDRREHAGRSWPTRCRSTSPTSPPGRPGDGVVHFRDDIYAPRRRRRTADQPRRSEPTADSLSKAAAGRPLFVVAGRARHADRRNASHDISRVRTWRAIANCVLMARRHSQPTSRIDRHGNCDRPPPAARRLLHRAARRSRSRDLRRDPQGTRSPAPRDRADRLGEHRLAAPCSRRRARS